MPPELAHDFVATAHANGASALRQFTVADAPFILALLNDPAFIRYIGDRNVRTLEQAAEYIETRFVPGYASGYGAYAAVLNGMDEPAGLISLLKRDWLEEADLGFAFLPAYTGRGYAEEGSRAMMAYAGNRLGLQSLMAIATTDNQSSHRLLGKLGFTLKRSLIDPADGAELLLFHAQLSTGSQSQE